MEWIQGLRIRSYGASGPTVFVLHGGPAAVGNAGELAQGLADSFRVYEPWQRGSGTEALTVSRHIADLHDLIHSLAGETQPALVGESWGAMLALAYAAEHPAEIGTLVLVGCGTFDKASRARLHRTLEERKNADFENRLERINEEFPDSSDRIQKICQMIAPLYSFDPIHPPEPFPEPFDLRAQEETWADMIRLQEEGIYPSSFSAIQCPVLMLHGAYDPHPGGMIRDSLRTHIPQLEYREWERCGHSPWLERAVRDEFFRVLRDWLCLRMG